MQTPEELAGSYVKLALTVEKLDAGRRWDWAKELSTLLDSLSDDGERTRVSGEIGKSIGEGLGRGAYSGSWVRLHAAAYKKFPDGLKEQADFRAFLTAVNGNASRAAKSVSQTNGEESSSDGNAETPDPLNKLRKLVRKLLKDGFAVSEIQQAVTDGLTNVRSAK